MALIYFDLHHAKKTHDLIISKTGGLPGIKNEGGLDSLLYHIQNDDYYPTFEDKITHLVFGLIKFHLFNDGNKRSSLLLGTYFLNINNYSYCSDNFIIQMENIVLWTAMDIVSKDLLNELISSIIEEPNFNEELNLKLYNALLVGTDKFHDFHNE